MNLPNNNQRHTIGTASNNSSEPLLLAAPAAVEFPAAGFRLNQNVAAAAAAAASSGFHNGMNLEELRARARP
jgi:hypothetical protein